MIKHNWVKIHDDGLTVVYACPDIFPEAIFELPKDLVLFIKRTKR
jgi:hypothetical protein